MHINCVVWRTTNFSKENKTRIFNSNFKSAVVKLEH